MYAKFVFTVMQETQTPSNSPAFTMDQIIGLAVGIGAAVVLISLMGIIIAILL